MNNFPAIGQPVLDPSEKYQQQGVDKFDQILTGQTFSETSYPALYAELGTNVIDAMDSGDPACPWRIVADLTDYTDPVELFDNPYFLEGVSGWNTVAATLSVSGGVMTVERNGGQYHDQLYQDIATEVGKYYRIAQSGLVYIPAIGDVNVELDTDSIRLADGWDGSPLVFLATATTHRVSFNGAGLAEAVFQCSKLSCMEA